MKNYKMVSQTKKGKTWQKNYNGNVVTLVETKKGVTIQVEGDNVPNDEAITGEVKTLDEVTPWLRKLLIKWFGIDRASKMKI